MNVTITEPVRDGSPRLGNATSSNAAAAVSIKSRDSRSAATVRGRC